VTVCVARERDNLPDSDLVVIGDEPLPLNIQQTTYQHFKRRIHYAEKEKCEYQTSEPEENPKLFGIEGQR
jgi:hypothetical protein